MNEQIKGKFLLVVQQGMSENQKTDLGEEYADWRRRMMAMYAQENNS